MFNFEIYATMNYEKGWQNAQQPHQKRTFGH